MHSSSKESYYGGYTFISYQTPLNLSDVCLNPFRPEPNLAEKKIIWTLFIAS
jgi:hypothetical protein